jgi:hypothetical protein
LGKPTTRLSVSVAPPILISKHASGKSFFRFAQHVNMDQHPNLTAVTSINPGKLVGASLAASQQVKHHNLPHIKT